MDNGYSIFKGEYPGADWKEIVEIDISYHSLTIMLEVYKSWGIEVYVWNLSGKLPDWEFEEIRVKIYYKNKHK